MQGECDTPHLGTHGSSAVRCAALHLRGLALHSAEHSPAVSCYQENTSLSCHILAFLGPCGPCRWVRQFVCDFKQLRLWLVEQSAVHAAGEK